MPARSPSPSSGDGPSPDATAVPVDRPTRPALGCLGGTALFLVAITAGAFGYAAGAFPAAPTTTLRVASGVAGALFVTLLVLLLAGLADALRAASGPAVDGLAVDGRGVWWTSRGAPVLLPWPALAAARVLPPTGPKRAGSGKPTLELFPPEAATVTRAVTGGEASHAALREKVAYGEAPEAGLPALRFAFPLPDQEAADRLLSAAAAAAPALRLLPPAEVPGRARRSRYGRVHRG